MRSVMLVAILLLVAATSGSAQEVSCRLRPSQYVFRGTCALDPAEPRPQGGFAALWASDSVKILMTSGPQERPPWRGNMSLPGLELSFEIAREVIGPEQFRLVLRTGLFWLLVKEWKDEKPDGLSLVFGLNDRPTPTADDIAILESAVSNLSSIVHWDRADDRDCTNDREGAVSLFCLLYAAIESRMGRYHHRQPALELVRQSIAERWPERLAGHPIMDLNNHAATTMADLRMILELSLGKARAQAGSGR